MTSDIYHKETSHFTSDVITFTEFDTVLLRIVGNGDGLSPMWYIQEGDSFNLLENSDEVESVYNS